MTSNELLSIDYSKLVDKWGKKHVEDVCFFIAGSTDHRGILAVVPATAERVEAILESIYQEPVGMSLSALGHLREARALLIEESEGPARSRELSVAITNVDTAILWRQHDLQIKEEPTNLEAIG